MYCARSCFGFPFPEDEILWGRLRFTHPLVVGVVHDYDVLVCVEGGREQKLRARGEWNNPCMEKCNGHQTFIVIIRNTKVWTNPFDTSADEDILNAIT